MQWITRIFLLYGLLVGEVMPLVAQSSPQVDSGSQPAVSALRALAQTIRECPRALTSEKRWGKGPSEIERWYDGPPQNVVWDVTPSNSVRSPYMGYIEFSISFDHWVSDEDKFMRSDAGRAYLIGTAGARPVKYRYEFDLGPSGLELARMLRRVAPAGGQYPTEWSDAGPERNTCWENAVLHKAQAASNAAATREATRADAPKTLDIQGSGKAFLQVCSPVDNLDNVANPSETKTVVFGLCLGYVEGVIGALQDQIDFNCFSSQGNPPTMSRILHTVINYIRNHSELADLPPAPLVATALRQAFPCEKK